MKYCKTQHESNLGQLNVSALTHKQTLILKSLQQQDMVNT